MHPLTATALVWSGVLLALPVSAPAATAETPRFLLEVEGGPAWQSRNDVQIPNDASGTRFSLVDETGHGPWSAARLYATWNISDKHGLRMLLAPFSITESTVLTDPLDFAGSSFSAGEPTEATYKFNSWRLSYRYRFHAGQRWSWWIGLTAKIRDAKIRLKQAETVAEKADVGFVPLVHVSGKWLLGPRWTLDLDLDALAGGPGRAEDGALKLRYRLRDRWHVAGGYRMLEGGADVDEVYNFAWLHYAVVSVDLALP